MIPFYQVDAFASNIFEGNPAAIVPLDNWLSDDLMRKIANENNLSETAFFIPRRQGYSIRWFTPVDEVDLCGHATLASAYVISKFIDPDTKLIEFQSRSGLLTVQVEGDFFTLDFPTDELYKKRPQIGLLESLGIPIHEAEIWSGRDDYLVIINSEDQLQNLTPDFAMLSKVIARGAIVSAPGNSHDFVSRCFFPRYGINEDPVTGSAHTTMIPYWAKRLNKTKLSARQISERGGDLLCEYLGERVKIGGQAQLYAKAEMVVQP